MVGGREILTKEVEARSDGKEVRVVEICVKCDGGSMERF